eukprot:scaffold2425_cov76-Skeletonema_dohrnii-CCMP3373.AAC.16
MPASRKKAKGKARKAAKAQKKEKEVEKATGVGQQEDSFEAQMVRLQIETLSLSGCNNNDNGLCLHGFNIPKESSLVYFIQTFLAEYNAAIDAVRNMEMSFEIAQAATMDKYSDVWDNIDSLEWVKSYFLSGATQRLLGGKQHKGACVDASFSNFLEQYVAVEIHKSQANINWMKVVELQNDADEHTLVSYVRKRIPCTCLNDKYKKVKSIRKVGMCCNPCCSHPGQKVERSSMLYCTQCRLSNYCSKECQVADWPMHKNACRAVAEFDSKQQS